MLIFAWLMVFVTGSQYQLGSIEGTTFMLLILSGLATGASWLCYFKALQLGDINKVVPIDKSSTILTILLAFILLHEEISTSKAVGVVLIAIGSAVFASLTSILGKIGISHIESNLGTAIRTGVVLVMSWGMVFASGKLHTVKAIPRKELVFIILSGLATGGSWLCYYKALQNGPASVVVPIDKLSILVTITFSYVVFHEKLTKKSGTGLLLIVCGTLAMLIPAAF